MRIVTPISQHDYSRVPEFVSIHTHLKPGLAHQLHFVVPPSLESVAQDAKAELNGLFESITVNVMQFEPASGHPKGPNAFFWSCANFMFRDNRSIPWQIVELDCRPLYQRAYDLIAARYASCGAPFFGHISKTPWRENDPFVYNDQGDKVGNNPRYGKIAQSRFSNDTMMSGNAVYPGDMIDRQAFKGLMEDFMKGEQSIDKAWDIHLNAAMKDRNDGGMAHTELIAQHWNTENYRIENGRIVCDGRQEHEIYNQHPDWEKRLCGGTVHQDAVMIHGCKDDSLTKLILGGQIPEVIAVAAQAPVPTVASTEQKKAEDSRLDKLESKMDMLLTQLLAQKSAPAPTVTTGGASTPPAVVTTANVSASAEPILSQVLEALPSVGKKQMLSPLAKSLNADKAIVKAAIEASGKFSIRGPAEWVERTAA